MTADSDCTLEEPTLREPKRSTTPPTTSEPDSLSKTVESLKRELAEAEAAVAQLQHDLDMITHSVVWRATKPLRSILARIPKRTRQRIFATLRSAYIAVRPRQVPVAGNGLVDEIALNYDTWVRDYDTLSEVDRAQITNHIEAFETTPLISVIMPVYQTPEHVLRAAIDSVIGQIYTHWELCIADDASTAPHIRSILEEYSARDRRIKCAYRTSNGHISEASNTALSLATGEYVALLDHDDVLAEHALYMVAEAIQRHPTAEVFYSDEDKLDADGKRCEPHFKPDWSPELFFGQNYLNHLTVYKTSAARRVNGFRVGFEGSQDYDLALRIVDTTTGPIVHIPHVLYHWRIFQGAGTMSSSNLHKATQAARQALKEHFYRKGITVKVGDVLGSFHRIMRPDPTPWPKVSVVIPTRDYLDVLRVTIDGLENKTDYPELEIIIADNESVQPVTRAYFDEVQKRGIHVVECNGVFNFSRINNRAIGSATGELVLLLNNDVSMIDPGWLKEMVRYFSDPDVGIVGAKLLYPDGTLQHAGVVTGIGGVAGHRYVNYPGDHPGQFGRLALAQETNAVTGACLLIRHALFDQVGGLDAVNLTVAFNDIDLCLKVRAAGYRVIWTPFAVLEHHESKSRGSDQAGEKLLRFQKEIRFMKTRWGRKLWSDPYSNPNLSISTCNPALAFPPRVRQPWKRH